MELGQVIRKYRKQQGMTQEEMAARLGVTAPAVNKWENGNSCPDILLLAPIARLLGISTDTLLCYREGLTREEIKAILEEIIARSEQAGYKDARDYAMAQLRQYPSCEELALAVATQLDGLRQINEVEDPAYGEEIRALYARLQNSASAFLAQQATVMLFYRALNEGRCDDARAQLERLPAPGADRDSLEALLCRRAGPPEKACEVYERRVFHGVHELASSVQTLEALSRENGETDKAARLEQLLQQLLELFEVGDYAVGALGLPAAMDRRDKARTLDLLEKMAAGLEGIAAGRHSPLYSHMDHAPKEGTRPLLRKLGQRLTEDKDLGFVQDEPRLAAVRRRIQALTGE